MAMSVTVSLLSASAGAPILFLVLVPFLVRTLGSIAGIWLKMRTKTRRRQLLELMANDQRKLSAAKGRKGAGDKTSNSPDSNFWENIETNSGAGSSGDRGDAAADDWAGVVGFFHPFCNAGGGGERVLWAAIRATQKRWPRALCVVYTGDQEASKQAILTRVKTRFNIDLYPPSVIFIYLSTRSLVLASTWPHFTLLGQSLGSMVLAWDAFQMLVPDIFVDTMGYAFAMGLAKLLFPDMPTGAYVHYPTISTDMIDSLGPDASPDHQGLHAGKGAGPRGKAKLLYWKLFAQLYSRVGSTADVVMTNSSWTQGHIQSLWGPQRAQRSRTSPIAVVYPPCAVEELEEAVEVSKASEAKREKVIIYIAQFRPEKNHQLILRSFAEFLKTSSVASEDARLVLLGSVRDDGDSKRVYELRLLANELGVRDNVDFHLDASWPEVLDWLRRASVGANGMWNEHFGIGVVEYQAAGLISVVHNSGGPKLDIVVDVDGQPTGFHATGTTEFAQGFEKALSTPNPLATRLRARQSARRFTEEEFAKKWLEQLGQLINAAT